jgi:succinyl-diaminopimelate desuccinylase
MTADAQAAIAAFLDASAQRQTQLLAELVRVPSDNPPGDCGPHAKRAAALLEGLGFVVDVAGRG